MNNVLKDKLRAAMADGSIALSSEDVVAATQAQVAAEPVKGDVEAAVPVAQDGLTAAAGSPFDAASAASFGLESAEDLALQFTKDKVTLTEAERTAFLEAVITGTRYTQPFSLFGGKVSGVFRCRLTLESDAIASWLNLQIRNKKFDTVNVYTRAIRNSALAAMVEQLNDVHYEPLAAPLYTIDNAGKLVEPAWVPQALSWDAKPEALVVALYEALRQFERKYWTMIVHAYDQDFWQPGERT